MLVTPINGCFLCYPCTNLEEMFILVGTGYAHGKRRGITLLAVWRAGIYEQGEMKHIKVTLPVIEQIKNTRCYSGLRLQHSNILGWPSNAKDPIVVFSLPWVEMWVVPSDFVQIKLNKLPHVRIFSLAALISLMVASLIQICWADTEYEKHDDRVHESES
ncbi:hypothetical protein JHK84_028309 [Glycine max]|nr:hypothetical protein JHK84_028309 [Glycine max]